MSIFIFFRAWAKIEGKERTFYTPSTPDPSWKNKKQVQRGPHSSKVCGVASKMSHPFALTVSYAGQSVVVLNLPGGPWGVCVSITTGLHTHTHTHTHIHAHSHTHTRTHTHTHALHTRTWKTVSFESLILSDEIRTYRPNFTVRHRPD